MLKRLIALLMVLSVGVTMFAQQRAAHISFKGESHNFGVIKEGDGPVNHTFHFTNTGSVPLIIREVKASCGCTSPVWSKEPILPGKDGFVKATFNPKGRRDNFNKSITVKTNSDNAVKVLRITGKIIPREQTLEEKYPRSVGAIRFKSMHLPFGRMDFGSDKVDTLYMHNSGTEVAKLSFDKTPEHIKISFVPIELKPGEEGKVIVHYDTKIKNDWDFIIDRLRLMVNGQSVKNNTITVTASIIENTSGWSQEDFANAAVVQFDATKHDFGTIEKGAKVVHEYTFTNKGKSDLVIRKVKASCGCTAVQPKKTVIKPGESSFIKTIYTGSGTGKQNKSITVITNDPKKSRVILRVAATVEPKSEK